MEKGGSNSSNNLLQVPSTSISTSRLRPLILSSNDRPRALSEVAQTRPNIQRLDARSRGLSVADLSAKQVKETEERSKSLSNLARQYALNVMAQHIFEDAVKQKLIMQIDPRDRTASILLQGVAFRATKGVYAHYPQEQGKVAQWVACLSVLNVGVSLSVDQWVFYLLIFLYDSGSHDCHNDRD